MYKNKSKDVCRLYELKVGKYQRWLSEVIITRARVLWWWASKVCVSSKVKMYMAHKLSIYEMKYFLTFNSVNQPL